MGIVGLLVSLIGCGVACGREVLTPKYTPDQTFEHMADLNGLRGEQRERYLREMGHSRYK